MLAHFLRDGAHTDTGKVVDGETGIPSVVSREDTVEAWTQHVVFQSSLQFSHAECFNEVLEEDLDEDTATRCCFLLIEMHNRKNMPANSIGAEHMTEEASDISESVRFVAVDSIVVFHKRGFKLIDPKTVQLRETFSDESVELGVGSFLRATFYDHRWQFRFLTCGEVDLHEFMTALLKVNAWHNGEVDCPAKINQIRVRLILDLQFFLLLCLLIIRTIITIILIIVFTARSFAQDLSFEFLISLFRLLPLRIKLENIQSILHLDFIIQTRPMCDLILLFHQVQLLFDGRIILVFILSHLKQYLNHVLNSLINILLMENASKLVKNSQCDWTTHFFQMLSNLSSQAHRNLHTIIRRLMQQKEKYLRRNHLMSDLLIDKMCDEGGRRQTHSLVVSLERLLELHNKPVQ